MVRTVQVALGFLALGWSARQAAGQTLSLSFSGEPQFQAAVEEYRSIWRADGQRIVSVLQRVSGMRFPTDSVAADVMEGPSWAGSNTMGMRASYSPDTKRATLVHELGHVLMGDLLPEDAEPGTVPEPHYVLFLFLYDAWVELWGEEFADQQVDVESARRGIADYEGTWHAVLTQDADARAAELRGILARYRPGNEPLPLAP